MVKLFLFLSLSLKHDSRMSFLESRFSLMPPHFISPTVCFQLIIHVSLCLQILRARAQHGCTTPTTSRHTRTPLGVHTRGRPEPHGTQSQQNHRGHTWDDWRPHQPGRRAPGVCLLAGSDPKETGGSGRGCWWSRGCGPALCLSIRKGEKIG